MLRRVEQSGELTLALADAGGPDAPLELSARLRRLLRAELERGARELGEARTGRERPIALAVAAAGGAVASSSSSGCSTSSSRRGSRTPRSGRY